MLFKTKEIILKDGTPCILRSPKIEEADKMMEYLKTVASETPFILRYPEECIESPEDEARFLSNINESENVVMIVAEVNGEIAGNCQLAMNKRLKTRHRGSIAIALISKYWNKGIGTAMFKEMIHVAKEKGLLQLELEFIEGNTRAQTLYEKMGFKIFGERKRAIILKDGTCLSEFLMVKNLDE